MDNNMIPLPSKPLYCMGAICGDVIGSTYEFHRIKHKHFTLFPKGSRPTDDSVMTVANMLWLTNPDENQLTDSMQQMGRKYPMAGYGHKFREWLRSDDAQPYGSFGNGSAMRVSPVAWVGDTLDRVLDLAQRSASVTHNHPEGIKGAQATAAAIFLARTGHDKASIKEYVQQHFVYDLSRTLSDIRPGYGFNSSCQQSVPEAIICFLEGTNYEDTIRNAVSLGGDADTQAAIAGSIAEAYYGGVPEDILSLTWQLLPADMQKAVLQFQAVIRSTEKQ